MSGNTIINCFKHSGFDLAQMPEDVLRTVTLIPCAVDERAAEQEQVAQV